MNTFPHVGIHAPRILIPNQTINLNKWAVNACDQYTSQIEYWHEVEKLIDGAPSTYNMILPEAYLGTEKGEVHASGTLPAMQSYLAKNVFREQDGFILVERSIGETTRSGLMATLDLELYDFNPESQSLIRATEGTIIDRLPPRIAIREKAPLEIPHILVLIDDPLKTVIEPLRDEVNNDDLIYDFELMKNGGHIRGYQIRTDLHEKIIPALETLRSPTVQTQKYGVSTKTPPLLYAIGDGNHSLATAKSIWEKNKKDLNDKHPARYALVELVNLHNPGIQFKAIHRLLIGARNNLVYACHSYFSGKVVIEPCDNFASLIHAVDTTLVDSVQFGLFYTESYYLVSIHDPKHTLSAGNVQPWLDQLLAHHDIDAIDYIHGAEAIRKLGNRKGNAGIYLPAMAKEALFPSVLKDGPLPRKTFSMGKAHQKRFYLECRYIK